MPLPSPEVVRYAFSAIVLGGGIGVIVAFWKARDEFEARTAQRVVIRAGSPEEYQQLCAKDRGAR